MSLALDLRRKRLARLGLPALLWLAALAIPCSAELPEDPPPTDLPQRKYSGILSFYFENDTFLNSDDNYTSGLGISWTSHDASTYGPRHIARGVVRATSFLPTVGAEPYRNFVSFTLGQEMYTPTDIVSPVPPPDQQPYAGILFLDSSVYSHTPASMHDFTLRLGFVGPYSGAEQAQTTIHEWIGEPIPQGWDHQLSNELLLNLNYQYYKRLLRRIEPKQVHYDFTMQAGGGLGNYYIGANVGLVARVGHRLPDNYGGASLRTGGAASFVGLTPPPGRGWQGYAFLGLQGFAVGRFLPTDGNTFSDSPGVDRDEAIANLSTGFVVGYGRFVLAWTLNNLAGITDFESSRSDDFGTLTLSYYFGRTRRDGGKSRTASPAVSAEPRP